MHVIVFSTSKNLPPVLPYYKTPWTHAHRMRHQLFPQNGWAYNQRQTDLRLQAADATHRRELAAVERAMLRRIEAAERLCQLVLFEHECAKRQLRGLVKEVGELRAEMFTGTSGEEEEAGDKNDNNNDDVIIQNQKNTSLPASSSSSPNPQLEWVEIIPNSCKPPLVGLKGGK